MIELKTVRNVIQRGIDEGLHPGAQVYASLRGEVVADMAVGEAAPGVAMTPGTLMLWMSSCKPVTAVAVAQQWELGRLDLEAPVAAYLPDFAQGGKAGITIRHLLTHTGGFRPTRFAYPRDDWDTIIATICATPIEPDWTPGEKAGYHVHTAWFILAELVQQASGERLPEYLRRHVFEPIGMNDSWIGMPPRKYHDYGGRISVMMNTAKQPATPLGWHDQAWVTHCRPSGNGYGPARELGRFYETLLAGGGPILQSQTVETFTARHREGMFDLTFQHVIDWGLGFLLGSPPVADHGGPHPYGYGAHASDGTFGHSGSQSSAAFADPAHGLAAAVIFNGSPGEPRHQKRIHAVLTALYEDLGLARGV